MHDGTLPRDRPGGPAGSRPDRHRPPCKPLDAGVPEQPAPEHTPTGSPAPGAAAPDLAAPDLAALAQDWITLWQSELAAAAVDRELQETWQTLAGLWAAVAGTMLNGLPHGGTDGATGHAAASRRARAAATPRPPPAAAAPDPRDAEIDRLGGRIAELERRLAKLERGGST